MKSNALNLESPTAYQQWREQKLADAASARATTLISTVDHQDSAAVEAIRQQICKTGFALYQLHDVANTSKAWLIRFGQLFGLTRLDSNLCADEDSVSSLQVADETEHKRGYIPYSNRPLNWHTDGYYNESGQRIGAFILHCVQDAAEGGENGLMDPELAYIRLRDENPAFIEALTHPEAMSIPPNIDNGREVHGWIHGPVFAIDPTHGLHMRYTARQRNIRWRDDATTLEAVAFLQNLLDSGENDVVWRRLSPGQGVISNNALHCRKRFDNSPTQQRLYYRARYFDRVRRT
ncbi:MAG TPA: taurine catabolism dioxygenase TauD [Gammaproteobacteria bacterium]|nr:taurine catabolism dioxygenase TauD [Gammaproteobacteria bacterium]